MFLVRSVAQGLAVTAEMMFLYVWNASLGRSEMELGETRRRVSEIADDLEVPRCGSETISSWTGGTILRSGYLYIERVRRAVEISQGTCLGANRIYAIWVE